MKFILCQSFLMLAITLASGEDTNSFTWQKISKSEVVTSPVCGSVEKYYIKYPCQKGPRYRLYFYTTEEGEATSFLDVTSRSVNYRGIMFCEGAGDKSWRDGEKTEFPITWNLSCEDGVHVVKIERSINYLKIKDGASEEVLYTKEFGAEDGDCNYAVKQVETRVLKYGGDSLFVHFPKCEHGTEEIDSVEK